MKFKITTLGCKVNIYESEAVSFDLIKRGYTLVDKKPDLQIINTCTVTQTSDAKSRKTIRSLIRENPKAITVVMGCYSQLDSEEVAKIPGVDIVVGTAKRTNIAELVEQYQINKRLINMVGDAKQYQTYEELKLLKLSKHTRGFIKVQDGCENFCTYCAIPYSRGPIKSRDPESVVAEIKVLVEQGVKEVVLTGINTGTYGQDLGYLTLAQLIDKIINEVPELYRIRLSSIELMEITDELLETLKRHGKKIAQHFHIPLQAGSDSVLKRMNRKYVMEDYFKTIQKIRYLFPNASITTDCLAGFVGETADEFQTTYDNIKKICFMECHIFPYSKRPGTKAYDMRGHLDPSLIKKRANALQALAKELKNEYYENKIGEIVEVLFEQKKDKYWIGHTTDYLDVIVDAKEDLENQIKRVRLLKNIALGLYGEVLDHEI